MFNYLLFHFCLIRFRIRIQAKVLDPCGSGSAKFMSFEKFFVWIRLEYFIFAEQKILVYIDRYRYTY